MATIFTPNCVTVDMIYTWGGQRVENVYNVTKGSPATAADLSALGLLLRDWEFNHCKSGRVTACQLSLIVLRAMDAPGAPFLEYSTGLPVTGTNATASLPISSCICVKMTTGRSGRSFRGRSYVIGLGVAQLASPSTFSQVETTSWVSRYSQLRTLLSNAGWTLCVLSKYSGVTPAGRAIPRAQGVLTPITGISADTLLDTQRHRRPRL